ncbi:hypothetical protein [Novacetimonas cocois]|uniref:Uncharacterized protein n=1 Tax=Novacetimonas cocois TaxID=1747507 RepID=A0A365YU41_9PROT|nr:hypothetical protein [Novacetimonas cocois]RBM06343.1 hypothetical protein NJLHNGOC_10130 [Novacetimonas cocois]
MRLAGPLPPQGIGPRIRGVSPALIATPVPAGPMGCHTLRVTTAASRLRDDQYRAALSQTGGVICDHGS